MASDWEPEFTVAFAFTKLRRELVRVLIVLGNHQ